MPADLFTGLFFLIFFLALAIILVQLGPRHRSVGAE